MFILNATPKYSNKKETQVMKIVITCLISMALTLVTSPASPHHAFASEFDINKPVSLEGPVTRMEWTNPHAWLFMESEDEDGTTEEWAVELVGINDLLRLGWGRDRIEVGDVISVQGFGARNGTNTANAASVTITQTGELLWESVANSGREGRERRRTPL
jgi:hypothetical protein